MIRTLMIAALMAGATATQTLAQEVVGDWNGKVTVPTGELTITMHVEKGASGALEGYTGSPDQTDMPLPMADIVFKDAALTFAVPMVEATYAGKWDAAKASWVGVLTQRGFDMPLILAHGKVAPKN